MALSKAKDPVACKPKRARRKAPWITRKQCAIIAVAASFVMSLLALVAVAHIPDHSGELSGIRSHIAELGEVTPTTDVAPSQNVEDIAELRDGLHKLSERVLHLERDHAPKKRRRRRVVRKAGN